MKVERRHVSAVFPRLAGAFNNYHDFNFRSCEWSDDATWIVLKMEVVKGALLFLLSLAFCSSADSLTPLIAWSNR